MLSFAELVDILERVGYSDIMAGRKTPLIGQLADSGAIGKYAADYAPSVNPNPLGGPLTKQRKLSGQGVVPCEGCGLAMVDREGLARGSKLCPGCREKLGDDSQKAYTPRLRGPDAQERRYGPSPSRFAGGRWNR